MHLPHLLPTDRHHLLSSLTNRQHNTKLILRRTRKVTSLISKTDNNSSHNIANAKTFAHFHFVDFSSSNVLLAYYGGERFAEHERAGGA